jgi:hypothetical protein
MRITQPVKLNLAGLEDLPGLLLLYYSSSTGLGLPKILGLITVLK